MDDLEIIIYKAFFDFIQGLGISENTFMANSNAIAPQGPYSTIEVISSTPVSWTNGSQCYETDDGLAETYTQYKGIVDIVFYGEKAFARASNAVAGLREDQLRKILSDRGFVYSSTTPVRDASVAIDAEKIEKASSFQISFYFVVGGKDRGPDAGVIESASILDNREETYTNWPEGHVYTP